MFVFARTEWQCVAFSFVAKYFHSTAASDAKIRMFAQNRLFTIYIHMHTNEK